MARLARPAVPGKDDQDPVPAMAPRAAGQRRRSLQVQVRLLQSQLCMVLPSPVPRRNWVCSTDGADLWYLAVDEHLRPSLHDPLTGAVTHLRLPTLPWEEEFNPCGVIYDDGTTFLYSLDHVVVGNGSGLFRAALLRPGDAEWTTVRREDPSCTLDLARIGSYVERELSVVVHTLEEETSAQGKKTRWVRKDGHSLADRVLFLGWLNSFAMDASRLGGRDSGCAFFVYYDTEALPHEKVGIFRYNLVNGNVKFGYNSHKNNAEFIERLPQGWDDGRCTWLVPQPAMAPIQELTQRALKARDMKQKKKTTLVTTPTNILHTERHYKPSFRVLVRNLPLTVTSSQLQLFFSNHGNVSSAEVIC
uniref:Uncharacterized protein n=1 Tax=Aegilops tauschii TaxID=37682 RepID=M8CXI6_AEGTA